VRIVGPDVLSGGWWRRTIHRDYYFMETVRGDLLWLFYDRRRRQWFLHGRVE
jgi:protein ImuB